MERRIRGVFIVSIINRDEEYEDRKGVYDICVKKINEIKIIKGVIIQLFVF